MKNVLILFAAMLLMTSCVKPETIDEESDKWNGYQKYLKMGEQYHTLWAGKHINVGTVTYGIDENANFYVTYDCSASGWKISETHLFAGDKRTMPLNKPGAPKIGLFPNSGIHNPKVSTFTYRIPLTSLPPCEEPGFVVASHCVVHSPGGRIETAWAEGDFTFTDKGWGWYDIYFYNQPANQFTILYGTAYTNDTLKLYHLDITSGAIELILEEYVGNASGNYDGAAYDNESGIFFFTNYNTGALWGNMLTGEDPSYCAGMLNGTSASGTFCDGAYYYVNEEEHTINMVTFNNDWMIAGELILDTLPALVVVNDIAMSPGGDFLYIMGQYDGSPAELITWNVSDQTFYSMAVTISEGAQIAFGSDGVLYAIAPVSDDGDSNYVYSIDTECGTLTVIEDEIIFIEDPFSDISGGPIM